MLFPGSRLLCLLTLVLVAAPVRAEPSPELAAALAAFRTEGPKGWAFTQTTTADGRVRVERFEPLQPAHLRWTLVSENGREPTPDQTRTYREHQTRRTGGETAPNVKEQLDYATATLRAEDGPRQSWHFRLKPGGPDDSSAAHMASTLLFNRDTGLIERIELASFEPFSPVFGVKVESARTTIDYASPAEGEPLLMQRITVAIRGRAFWLKSLDSDMTVEYSDYRYAGKR